MTISSVGSLAKGGTTTGNLAVSVSPTTLGNCLVLYTLISTQTLTIASVSGGGAASWTAVETPFVNATVNSTFQMWLGAGITSTGASTITITGSGSLASITTDLSAQEFTAGLGAGTVWAVKSTNSIVNAGSSNITYPSLTATGGELYVGENGGSQGAAATTGAPAGYVFIQNNFPSRQVCYNANCSAGANQPTSTITGGPTTGSAALGALITATAGAATSTGWFDMFE